MCANTEMLNGTLRNAWKFDGYVTSDCGAVNNVWTPEPNGHGYTTATKAAAISVIAGTDVDCGSQYLLRQIFLLTLSPFRSTDLFAGAGTPNTSRKRLRLAT